jgi:hypothetical protein
MADSLAGAAVILGFLGALLLLLAILQRLDRRVVGVLSAAVHPDDAAAPTDQAYGRHTPQRASMPWAQLAAEQGVNPSRRRELVAP